MKKIYNILTAILKSLMTNWFTLRYRCHSSIGNQSYLIGCKSRGKGYIEVGNHAYLNNCSFIFGEGEHHVTISDDVKLRGVQFILRHGGTNKIVIGKGTTTGGNVSLEASEGTSIKIGDDCMLSHFIRIYTTDSHSIYNLGGTRINHARDIEIEDHVWIGMNVMVLKGTVIPEGSIVGANSTCSGSDLNAPNSIYAGQPAKLVKRYIRWERSID